MKYATKIITFILISALLLSCEFQNASDVNQDKIYTDYEVFYNSNRDITYVFARFSFGGRFGTRLTLDEDAVVYFNDEELPFSELHNAHYMEFVGKITSGTFKYINNEGEEFINESPTWNEIEFPDDFKSLSKERAYELLWEGSALIENESVHLFVGSWTWGDDALFFNATRGATSLILSKTKIGNIADGNSTCYMDRFIEEDVQEGTSQGGLIRAKYRAPNVEISVK